MSKKNPPQSELVLRENGLWAILERTGKGANVVETGHVDRVLAEQDLACWRTFGRMSTSGQAWLDAATRLVKYKGSRGKGGSVNRTEILTLLLSQGYRCPISGVILEPIFDGPWQPSIDRIDNAKGYEVDNVRVVALIVNYAMNEWGALPLIELAERIVAHANRTRAPLRLTLCEEA